MAVAGGSVNVGGAREEQMPVGSANEMKLRGQRGAQCPGDMTVPRAGATDHRAYDTLNPDWSGPWKNKQQGEMDSGFVDILKEVWVGFARATVARVLWVVVRVGFHCYQGVLSVLFVLLQCCIAMWLLWCYWRFLGLAKNQKRERKTNKWEREMKTGKVQKERKTENKYLKNPHLLSLKWKIFFGSVGFIFIFIFFALFLFFVLLCFTDNEDQILKSTNLIFCFVLQRRQ